MMRLRAALHALHIETTDKARQPAPVSARGFCAQRSNPACCGPGGGPPRHLCAGRFIAFTGVTGVTGVLHFIGYIKNTHFQT